MKKFKVFIRGNNYLLREIGKLPRKCGFYTTVFVEAVNAEQAEALAVELLKTDSKLNTACENNISDPPIIKAESIDKIESFDGCKLPRMGLALFEETT
ncbi:MAG: hypothetical protein WDN00_13995 [Limisphaerales bacterium]